MTDPYQPANEQDKQKIQKDESTINIEKTSEILPNVEGGKNTQDAKDKEEIESENVIETEGIVKINIEDDIITQALENRTTQMLKKKEDSFRKKWSFKRRKLDHYPPVKWETERQDRLPPVMVYCTIQTEGEPFDYNPEKNAFIRRIFSVVIGMISFSLIFIIICAKTTFLWSFMYSRAAVFLGLFMIIVCGVVSVSFCCCKCARRFRNSIGLNIVGTLALTFVCGYITIDHDPCYIVLCVVTNTLIIAIICFGMSFTKFNFNTWKFVIVGTLVALVLSVLMVVIMHYPLDIFMEKTWMLTLTLAGTANSGMMLGQLKKILEGRNISVSEEEYVFGAFMIYTAMAQMIFILVLISLICCGGRRRSSGYGYSRGYGNDHTRFGF